MQRRVSLERGFLSDVVVCQCTRPVFVFFLLLILFLILVDCDYAFFYDCVCMYDPVLVFLPPGV
jgi:hypothetical protein